MLPKGFEPLSSPLKRRVYITILPRKHYVRPVELESTLPYKARIKIPVHKPILPQAHL